MHIYTQTKSWASFLKKTGKQFLLMLLILIGASQAYAQVPVNDEPCGAIELTANVVCTFQTFTNVDASLTTSVPVPTSSTCGNLTDADVWFKVTVPPSGAVTIDSKGLAMSDGAMSVYSGATCSALTFVSCDDESSTNTSFPTLSVSGTPGSTLWIRFYGFGGETGTFQICVKAAPAPPVNDNCTAATGLTVNPDFNCASTANGTTAAATLSGNLPNPTCGTANGWNDDVWYSFTAQGPAHRITLTNVSGSTSMTMNVYSGTCGALVQVAGGCINGNTLNLTGLTSGTTYLVRVYTNTATAGTTATFTICVGTPPPPPANDNCAAATVIPPASINTDFSCTNTVPGTTISATPSTTLPVPTCSATGINDDVWYSFTAAAGTHRISVTNPTALGMSMALYSGTCTGGFTELFCSTSGTLYATGLTVGTVYYLRVYTSSATVGTETNFTLCIGTPPPPPANDECVASVHLDTNPDFLCASTANGTTAGATQSTQAPTPGCGTANGWNDDVWYNFTATSTVHRITLTNIVGDVTSMTMAVYEGTCGGTMTLVPGGCINANTLNLTNLTVGTVYQVRVYTNTATAGQFANFTICVGTPPPPPPNDEPCAAIPIPVGSTCNYTTYTNTSATATAGVPAPGCANYLGGDVWFSVVVPAGGALIFDSNTGVITDGGMAIYSGTCGNLTLIECDDDDSNNGLMSMITATGLTPGSTVWIRFWEFGNDNNGTFGLCVTTPPPPPANDNCSTPTNLTVSPTATCTTSVPGTTAGATQSTQTPNPACGTANGWNDDVWYTFTATGANHAITLSNVSGGTDMTIVVYSGSCGGTMNVFQCTQGSTTNLYGLTPGTLYTVRVYTNSTSTTVNANFNICVTTIPPPGPGAICNVSSPFCSTSQPAQTSPTGQPSLGGGGVFGCLGTTPNPTWYVLQVQNPGSVVINIHQETPGGVPIDVDYAVWGPFTSIADGCTQIGAGTITPISCSYSTAANETATIPNGQTGQYYIMLVTNFNGQGGIITFTPNSSSTGTTNCGIVCNGTAGNNGPVCPSGTFNLTATSTIVGATYAWVGPGGFTSAAQNPTGLTASATPGNYVYTLTVTSGTNTCTSTTTVVVGQPAAPAVVSPVVRCQNSTPAPLTATGTNLLWYTGPTGGVGSATAPSPATTTIGSTNYYVSQTSGAGCESPRALIVVNIVATLPAPGVTSPVAYCQNATATQLTATGSGLLWYTAPTGGTGTATAPTPSTATPGATTYYVTQSSGSCESPRAAIVVNVTATPAAPTVTTPVNYCQNATAVQLSATGTGLLWYTAATGGTGSATAPTPSTATPGTTTYYVTQTVSTCESPRAAIVVNVSALPAAPTVTTPVVYCQNTTATPLTATGTGLLWYTAPTGGTGSATAPTPSTATVGSTTYYVSQNSGSCEGPRAAIVVNVVAVLPAPGVTTPVVYCQGATAVPLTATGTGLLWYTLPTGGTGSATAPTPSTSATGNTTYYVSQTNGTCESPRAAIVVTINPTPGAPTVTTPVLYCQSATATPLTATGTGLLWYTAATGGTGSATAPTPATSAAGSTTYYVSQTTGTCEGPRAAIVVTVTATPALPAVTTPVAFCRGSTATQLTATGTGLLWYTAATGGTGSATAPTPSTATAGSTTYYVSQSTGTCEGPRAAIVVNINPTPGAPTVTGGVTYCQGATNAVPLTATGTGLLWYTASTGGTGSATAPTPSTSTPGTTTYYVSQTTGTCEGPRAPITVTINPALTVNAGPDALITYGQQIQLAGTATTGGQYLWTSNVTPLALNTPTILTPLATPLQTTTFTLTVSDPSNICPSKSDDVVITVITTCIDVKNAFSPNGDGVNDYWHVYEQYGCLSNVTVTVFNRYGNKVFESKNYRNDWYGTYKGKPVPDGTYYAVLEFTRTNGVKQFVKTDLTILR